MLGEFPGLQQGVAVAIILFGASLLEVREARTGLLTPLLILLRRPGAALAIVASMLWGTTTVLEKLAIEHVRPPSGPLVALVGTLLTVILLTPNALTPFFRQTGTPLPEEPSKQSEVVAGLGAH